jgi:hypothetical protein
LGIDGEQSIKNYPYLKELLAYTKTQDYLYILDPDFNEGEKTNFDIGFSNIVNLVQKYSLQDSTGLIGVFLFRKFVN